MPMIIEKLEIVQLATIPTLFLKYGKNGKLEINRNKGDCCYILPVWSWHEH